MVEQVEMIDARASEHELPESLHAERERVEWPVCVRRGCSGRPRARG